MKVVAGISALVFAIIAIVHVLRLIYGWQIIINGTVVPMWVSIPGAVIPGLLAIALCCCCKKNANSSPA